MFPASQRARPSRNGGDEGDRDSEAGDPRATAVRSVTARLDTARQSSRARRPLDPPAIDRECLPRLARWQSRHSGCLLESPITAFWQKLCVTKATS